MSNQKIRKLNFSILSSLYANLTRVVKERRASLLGLVMGSQPGWSLCQHNTSSTEQFYVIFQDLVQQDKPEASSHLTPVSICGIHPRVSIHIQQFGISLTRRYRRCSLTSCQRTINMPQPSHITVINILTPIIPIFTYCSSPILHYRILVIFSTATYSDTAVPHLRLVLGVGATHLLLYDIGSLKSYLGLFTSSNYK